MPSQTSRFPRLTAQAGAAETPTLVVNAVLAALLAVATTLGLCMAVALVGWFFADSGAHGNTLDALRVGGVAWVLGLGGSADTNIGHIGLTPLGLTAIEVLAVIRSAHWGWRRSEVKEAPGSRALGMAWAVFIVTFVVLAVIVLSLFEPSSMTPSMAGTFLGALLISAIPSLWVGLSESGLIAEVWGRLSLTARASIRIGIRSTLLLIAAAALLVAVSLVRSFAEVKQPYNTLGLGFGDGIMLTILCALTLPNAVGLALAYLSGPGFAVGVSTSVTVNSVALIPLPLFPTVAALPDAGPQPGWYVVLLFVPALCALVSTGLIQREFADAEDDGWDQVALRGIAGGVLAGVLIAVFAAFSGGALGDHRMSQIGAGFWAVLVTAAGGMALGGAVGGLAVAGWQRWRH
ncbi:MAG TPA: DUF6350 family protein [Marmoricola sp.]|nr:DUF6350 family protein [Marmoricola sp.]